MEKYICRICLNSEGEFSNIDLIVKEMIMTCLPEMDLGRVHGNVICNGCRSDLCISYRLKNNCSDTNRKIAYLLNEVIKEEHRMFDISAIKNFIELLEINVDPHEMSECQKIFHCQEPVENVKGSTDIEEEQLCKIEVTDNHLANVPVIEEAEEQLCVFRQEATFTCSLCLVPFKSKKALNMHIIRKHQHGGHNQITDDHLASDSVIEEAEEQLSVLRQETTFICSFCLFICKSKKALNMHILRKHQHGDHNQEQLGQIYLDHLNKDLIPNECEIAFPKLKPGSKRKKIYRCIMCNKKFSTAKFFKIHIKGHIHCEYKCTVCGKSFAFKSGLVNHQKMHKRKNIKKKRLNQNVKRRQNLRTLHPIRDRLVKTQTKNYALLNKNGTMG